MRHQNDVTWGRGRNEPGPSSYLGSGFSAPPACKFLLTLRIALEQVVVPISFLRSTLFPVTSGVALRASGEVVRPIV